MAQISTGIVDQQPGHASLHNEERAAHNVNDTRIGTALTNAANAQAKADAAYVKPAAGIPNADLSAAVTALFGAVAVREYVAGAWQARGAVATNTVVFWVKRVSTQPDPPIDATFFKQGTDLLFKP